MARLIPARSACLSRMTSGERRFAQRLEDKLEDDYLVWYDVPVGVKQRQPDFVVLHPRRGLLVLDTVWSLIPAALHGAAASQVVRIRDAKDCIARNY